MMTWMYITVIRGALFGRLGLEFFPVKNQKVTKEIRIDLKKANTENAEVDKFERAYIKNIDAERIERQYLPF